MLTCSSNVANSLLVFIYLVIRFWSNDPASVESLEVFGDSVIGTSPDKNSARRVNCNGECQPSYLTHPLAKTLLRILYTKVKN